MRRTLASLVLASTALFVAPLAVPASAVCGGGEPGEACYCPPGIKIKDKEIVAIYC